MSKVADINFPELMVKSPNVFAALMETLTQSGAVLMFNRLKTQQEIWWDSKPYVFPGHKVKSVPVDVAIHAVRHSHCYYTVGAEGQEEMVEDWFLVPYGYSTFCQPVTALEEDQILDPIAYTDLSSESQFLPIEASQDGKSVWRRVRRQSVKPRNGVRPVVFGDGLNAVFMSRA